PPCGAARPRCGRSDSWRYLALAEPYLLTVATEAVKDDGGRAPHGEMVPAADTLDRREQVVGAPEDVLGEAPARPEHEQLRPGVRVEARRQVGEREPPAALPRAGRDQAGQDTLLPLDVRDHRVEVVRQARERKRLLPRLVVRRPRTGVPVSQDALHEP